MLKKQQVQKRLEKFNDSGIYDCYICYSRFVNPLKCLSCQKMMCGTHIDKIKNKCPNCRAQPFKFEKDQILGAFLKQVSKEEWQTLKKQEIYSCMITGCQFKGKYVAMLKHRKKAHSALTIEDVMTGQNVSDEARKAAMMRTYKMMQLCLSALHNPLHPDNPQEKKKHPNPEQARRMAEHVATCTNDQCRKLWNTKWGTYIGRASQHTQQFHFSECSIGKQMNLQLQWKYDDPKH